MTSSLCALNPWSLFVTESAAFAFHIGQGCRFGTLGPRTTADSCLNASCPRGISTRSAVDGDDDLLVMDEAEMDYTQHSIVSHSPVLTSSASCRSCTLPHHLASGSLLFGVYPLRESQEPPPLAVPVDVAPRRPQPRGSVAASQARCLGAVFAALPCPSRAPRDGSSK